MADEGKEGGFFTLPHQTITDIVRHGQITGRHIAALLVLSCFSSKDHQTTRAGVQAVQNYVGVSRPVAQRILQDLQSWGFVATPETSRYGARYILSTTVKDELVYLPQSLVVHESQPLKRLASMRGSAAAKVLLLAYAAFDQSGTIACAPGLFPWFEHDTRPLDTITGYELYSSDDGAYRNLDVIEGLSEEVMIDTLCALVREKLLYVSRAVYQGDPEGVSQLLYNITAPAWDTERVINRVGTRLKELARLLGHPIKEGVWCFLNEPGAECTLAATLAPTYVTKGPHHLAGIEAFSLRQTEIERKLVECEQAAYPEN